MNLRAGGRGGHDVDVVLTDLRACMSTGTFVQYAQAVVAIMPLVRAGLGAAAGMDLWISRPSLGAHTFTVVASYKSTNVWSGTVRPSEVRAPRVARVGGGADEQDDHTLFARAALAAGLRMLRSPAAHAAMRLLEVTS